MKSLLSFAGNALAEAIWPTRCAGCNKPGDVLCERCRDELILIDPASACPSCGAAFGLVGCTECPTREVKYPQHTIACALYKEPLSRMIVTYKEYDELRLAWHFGKMLSYMWRSAQKDSGVSSLRDELALINRIVFIPSAQSAFARRGFDHMELVAQELSENTGVPVTDVLIKHDTASQKKLNRSSRLSLDENAFECISSVEGLRVLLIDDVLTTGATLDHAARALLECGALSVTGLVLARSM